jgi:hypothetical protein
MIPQIWQAARRTISCQARSDKRCPIGFAAIALFCDIYKLLVEKQVLTQGDAVARLEKVANAIMASDTGTSRAHAVVLIDIVRDGIAGDPKRKPS